MTQVWAQCWGNALAFQGTLLAPTAALEPREAGGMRGPTEEAVPIGLRGPQGSEI